MFFRRKKEPLLSILGSGGQQSELFVMGTSLTR